MKVNDKVYLQYKAYLIWVIQCEFGSVDLTKPIFIISKEIDFDNPGIIKGFQSPKFDGRDTVVKWKDMLWDTAIPSQFLIKEKT